MSKVAVIRCEDYKQELVDEALRKSLELLGGLTAFVKPGDKVLLKVNALMGVGPSCAATTDPAIVKAVAKAVIKVGGIPMIGDSPGNASENVTRVYRETLFLDVAKELSIELAYFEKEGVVESVSSRGVKHKVSRTALNADAVINLPKIKTHNFTLFTGAVKNMFGSILGFNKGEMHYKYPKPQEFAEMLVDIFEITKPKLNIMDAVIGMEGHGPSGGHPRKMGAIIASADGVALDAACSYLIGYKPEDIYTSLFAAKRGLGEIDLSKIEILGESLELMRQADWKHASDAFSILNALPSFVLWLVKPIAKQIYIKPEINNEKCTQCLVCLKSCPVKTIKMKNGYPKVYKDKCIMCFCCHELCEFKAIKLKRSWLAKKLYIGYEDED